MDNELTITIRPAANSDVSAIRALVFGVLEEYGLIPEPGGTDSDIADIASSYFDRGGLFEVLEDSSGRLLGTVGLYPMDQKTVELRKMYFTRELRGKGFGKKTLSRMIEKARELGFARIYLETASPLVEAIGLYKKFGFQSTCEMHTDRCDQAYFLPLN